MSWATDLCYGAVGAGIGMGVTALALKLISQTAIPVGAAGIVGIAYGSTLLALASESPTWRGFGFGSAVWAAPTVWFVSNQTTGEYVPRSWYETERKLALNKI